MSSQPRSFDPDPVSPRGAGTAALGKNVTIILTTSMQRWGKATYASLRSRMSPAEPVFVNCDVWQ